MFSCASLETEAVVDVAVLLCEYLFQTNTLPLAVHEFTSLTYKNRKLLVLSNIC